MIYFIVNEKSRTGKGKEIWKQIKSVVDKRHVEYEYYFTEHEGHGTELANLISNKPGERIYLVVVGGDGTVNEVINGVTDFDKVYLGVIPTGSGNDFGRGVGLSGTPAQLMDKILIDISKCEGIPFGEADVNAIDIGKVSYNGCKKPRYFTISSGVGLDAIVCKDALDSKIKKFLNLIHLGHLTYVVLTVINLFTMDTADVTVILDHKKKAKFKRMIFAAGMNFKAEGGGVPMAPKASATDGRLNMTLVHGYPKFVTFFLLPLLVAGKHTKLRGFRMFEFQTCYVKLEKPMTVHADGEYCAEVNEIHFECVAGKLKVLGV